jgi:hypothetical protein
LRLVSHLLSDSNVPVPGKPDMPAPRQTLITIC